MCHSPAPRKTMKQPEQPKPTDLLELLANRLARPFQAVLPAKFVDTVVQVVFNPLRDLRALRVR